MSNASDPNLHGIFPDYNPNTNILNVFKETVDPELKVAALLKQEETRLTNKKKAIDPVFNTKQRHDSQLKSITKRKNAYNYMVLVSVVAFAVVMALFVLKNNFPLLPEWFMNIFLMVTISGSIIYLLILYADILKRDTTDFEKVDFGLLVEVDKVKEVSEGGLGVTLGKDESDIVDCVGSKCCPTGASFWWGNKCNTEKEPFSTRLLLSNNSSISSFAPMPSFTPV